ncbi:G-protein coupled receptor Mth-like [Drosophila innubila]|uniref:G-protein coupled receptor Mth-like n=1 Tax=Drosophila innubila TaxID=198719 RepID=UPI00148E2173|nr:G-protein coupled receptor Mth-like [Drosophila innubila]
MLMLYLLLTISSTTAEIPGCDYFDTVKLTESKKLPNGSYLYEKIIIPPEQTGEYDYEILVDGEKVDVPKHLRGCACKLGNCIRFCCQRNLMLVAEERKCSGDINKILNLDPFVELTLTNGSQVRMHLLDELIIQEDLPVPCSGHFYLDANQYESHGWTLFEDGTMLREFDNKTLSKQEYCLQAHPIKSSGNVTLVPHFCEDPPENPWPTTILLILTIICLVLTVIVYLSLPKLRNLHGICFVCYLLCLLVGYTLLLSDKWKWISSKRACQANGYVGYFAVMSGFLWLTVISYDLWSSFRSKINNFQQYTPKYRFVIYSVYVWGIAAGLTIIVIIMDHILEAENEDHLPWVPGVALYNCWIKTDDWSAMIYFYGPMSLQIIFNLIMFVLTAVCILKVMEEFQTIVARQERQQRLKSDKKTYSLFVRLFVIMGVTWTFEIFSYLSQSNAILEKIFIFFDYINLAQGVIIFIMFVLKRSVFKLISDRVMGIEPTSDDEDEEIVLQEREGYFTRRDFVPSILN